MRRGGHDESSIKPEDASCALSELITALHAATSDANGRAKQAALSLAADDHPAAIGALAGLPAVLADAAALQGAAIVLFRRRQ